MDGWSRRGCVYGILIENDRALTVQRKPDRKHYANLIETPGGKLELGEDYPTGLVREWLQEVNLVVEPIRFLRGYEIRHPDTGELVPKRVYLVRRVSGELSLNKHAKALLLTEDEIGKYGGEMVENFAEDIRAGFRAVRDDVRAREPLRLQAATSA